MRVKTKKICGCGRNIAVLAVMSLLAGAGACSSHDKSAAPSSAGESAPQFALTVSGLPACGSTRDGQVYFVSSDSNFYVCRSSGSTWAWVQTNLNGFNGASRVTAVSPGSQCPAGGYSIQFGLDQNRNGTLDTTEVSSTTVVCNGSTGPQGPQGPQGATGATGATGQSGLQSLIATTPEPAGANCASGGIAVKSGLDLNRDGTLQPAEVQNTSFVCNGTSGGCGAGSHDNGSGTCVPTGCPTGNHNGGDGICVPTGTCSEAYHNDGLGGCLQEGCALGFHDGGGICVADGMCEPGWHDNGEGICVHSGCAFGFHDNGAGTCVQTGCSAGYHNGGDRTCVAPGTCVEGYHNDGTGACVQAGCALGFHDGGGTCVANGTGGPDAAVGDGAAGTPQGGSCSAASQCAAGLSCTDGVCCAAASCGTCGACNLDTPGICSRKPAGASDSACGTTPASCETGTCDGAGSCQKAPNGTSCGAGQTCNPATKVKTAAHLCATGTCTAPTATCPLGCNGTDCATGTCGNGIVETGEQCDNGAGNNNSPYCPAPATSCSGCNTNCLTVAGHYCGDSSVQSTYEQCDNGPGNSNTIPYCAPPATSCPSGCNTSCQSVIGHYCGDGSVQAAETCDKGSGNSNTAPYCAPPATSCAAGCTTSCQSLMGHYCGDGMVQAAEACDNGSGNSVYGTCSPTCKTCASLAGMNPSLYDDYDSITGLRLSVGYATTLYRFNVYHDNVHYKIALYKVDVSNLAAGQLVWSTGTAWTGPTSPVYDTVTINSGAGVALQVGDYLLLKLVGGHPMQTQYAEIPPFGWTSNLGGIAVPMGYYVDPSVSSNWWGGNFSTQSWRDFTNLQSCVQN